MISGGSCGEIVIQPTAIELRAAPMTSKSSTDEALAINISPVILNRKGIAHQETMSSNFEFSFVQAFHIEITCVVLLK